MVLDPALDDDIALDPVAVLALVQVDRPGAPNERVVVDLVLVRVRADAVAYSSAEKHVVVDLVTAIAPGHDFTVVTSVGHLSWLTEHISVDFRLSTRRIQVNGRAGDLLENIVPDDRIRRAAVYAVQELRGPDFLEEVVLDNAVFRHGLDPLAADAADGAVADGNVVRCISLPLEGVVGVLHGQAVEDVVVVLVEADRVVRRRTDFARGRVGPSSKSHVERLLFDEERSRGHLFDRVALEPVGTGRCQGLVAVKRALGTFGYGGRVDIAIHLRPGTWNYSRVRDPYGTVAVRPVHDRRLGRPRAT